MATPSSALVHLKDITRGTELRLAFRMRRGAREMGRKAREMARTMRGRSDSDGADIRLRIIVAIEALQDQPNRGRLQ
jgi:hypothetical protein